MISCKKCKEAHLLARRKSNEAHKVKGQLVFWQGLAVLFGLCFIISKVAQ